MHRKNIISPHYDTDLSSICLHHMFCSQHAELVHSLQCVLLCFLPWWWSQFFGAVLNSDSDLIWSPSNTNTNPAPFSFSLIKLERAEMSEHLELFQKLHHTDLVMLVKTAIIALRSHIRTFASLNCVMKAVHLISPPRNKQTHPRIFI